MVCARLRRPRDAREPKSSRRFAVCHCAVVRDVVQARACGRVGGRSGRAYLQLTHNERHPDAGRPVVKVIHNVKSARTRSTATGCPGTLATTPDEQFILTAPEPLPEQYWFCDFTVSIDYPAAARFSNMTPSRPVSVCRSTLHFRDRVLTVFGGAVKECFRTAPLSPGECMFDVDPLKVSCPSQCRRNSTCSIIIQCLQFRWHFHRLT